MTPIDKLNQWILAERTAGAPNPQQAVLSTATKQAIPHSRVVAIREINEKGLLFFTQRGTRKVEEMTANPSVSMTFWFELLIREIIIEGIIEALSDAENELYWQDYPREAQIKFHSYAPTSSKPIKDKEELELKRSLIREDYAEKLIPLSSLYCGFRLKPNRFVFYSYHADVLSDVVEYTKPKDEWQSQLLSP